MRKRAGTKGLEVSDLSPIIEESAVRDRLREKGDMNSFFILPAHNFIRM